MQKCEKGFFPLSEVEQSDIEGIKVSLNLPEWVDQNRVGVNLRGIYSMCNMGGIENIRILGSLDDEVSTYTPAVVGINPDGSGIAGKVGLKTKVPIFSSSREDYSSRLPLDFLWIDATVNLNLREIKCKILDGKNKSVRDANNWVGYLDEAIKSGVSKEGVRHLVKDVNLSEKFTFPTSTALLMYSTLSATGFVPNAYTLPGFITNMAIYSAVSHGGIRLLLKSIGVDKKQRLSFFYGPQLDRALVLKLMSKTGKLIKELKNTGKNIKPTDAE